MLLQLQLVVFDPLLPLHHASRAIGRPPFQKTASLSPPPSPGDAPPPSTSPTARPSHPQGAAPDAMAANMKSPKTTSNVTSRRALFTFSADANSLFPSDFH